MTTYLISGVVASLAGLLVFLVIHHFWILPIWFILPPGLLIAVLGGLAVGWSYHEIAAGLPPRPWTSLAYLLPVRPGAGASSHTGAAPACACHH